MRDRIFLVFDHSYTSNGNLVFAAAQRVFRQMGAAFSYSIFTHGRYRGPRFGPEFKVDVAGVHPYRYNQSMRIRDRIRRKFANWRMVERTDRWMSNVSASEEALLLALRETDQVHAVLFFSTDPEYGLKWIRITHVFATRSIPHLVVVTPVRRVVPQIAEDIRWLGGRILRDSFTFPHLANQALAPRATAPAQPSESRVVTTLIEIFASFDAPKPFVFLDRQAYPYLLNTQSPDIDWRDWVPADRPYRPRVRDVVLFVRPDWMSCGSGTTFNSLARWFRANEALLIDIAIWPYADPFDARSRDAQVAEEQREIGAALYFSLRRSASMPYLVRQLAKGFRWLPRTIANQVMLLNATAAQPAVMCKALEAAKLSHIYINHYFTYLFAENLIKGRKFFLDTHDIQSINFVHHGTRNIIFRREDQFRTLLQEEMAVLRKAERLCFVSQEERAIAAEFLPDEKSDVIIALPPVDPCGPRLLGTPPRLLLVASNNPANQRNLTWFLGNVWLNVLRHYNVGQAGRKPVYPRLEICGSIATSFERTKLPGVRFLGLVEDLADAYERCDAVVLPVIMGGGIAIKTIEALLYERPVIATRHALRGLSPELVETLGHYDDPEAFARQIVAVLTSTMWRDEQLARTRKAAQILRDADYYGRLANAMRQVRLDDGMPDDDVATGQVHKVKTAVAVAPGFRDR
ncbi:MAG: glycosyltransferase [Acetobacteraceae bacterium]